jgi:endonuclease/exonuclease/phosphatase family metal-dependent hydrolase
MGKHALDTPRASLVGTVSVGVALVVVVALFAVLGQRANAGGSTDDGVADAAASTAVSSAPASPSTSATPSPTPSAPSTAPTRRPERRNEPSAPRTSDGVDGQKVGSDRSLADRVEDLADVPPPSPTEFRVTSLNILGHSHTTSGPRARRYPSGPTRAGFVADLLASWDVDVAGLQELQAPQWGVLARRLPNWSHYGPGLGREVMANSIIWDSRVWELVDGNTIQIPYFGGRRRGMPYVLLRNLATGQEVWFANFHNPADAHGPAQRWRNAATAIQIQLANNLGADGTPVVFTGDFNDREQYFCPIVANTALEASQGGSADGGCAPPAKMDVDWVFGSPPIQFTQHIRVIDGLIDRTTDHPMIVADAFIPPPLDSDSAS